MLRVLIIKVTIATNTVAIALSKAALRAWLPAGNVAGVDSAAPATPGFEDDPIEHTLRARPQRCVREVRLIVTSAEGGMRPPRESPALIKALAQGHLWLAQLLRGSIEPSCIGFCSFPHRTSSPSLRQSGIRSNKGSLIGQANGHVEEAAPA